MNYQRQQSATFWANALAAESTWKKNAIPSQAVKKSGSRLPAFFQNRGIEILVGLINPKFQIAAKNSRSRKYQIGFGCPLIFGEEYLRAGSSVQ
jgi:hypothetical protein